MTKFVVEGKDLGINYTDGVEVFEVSQSFDLRLEFSKLNNSINLYKIDSH
jgi:hypothetical protein